MAGQVLYEVALWRLDEQLERIRELNSRLMGIFTGATALLVLFAAFENLDSLAASSVAVGFASAAVGIYVALMLTAVLGYRHPELRLGPLLDDLRQGQDDDLTRQFAAVALQQSVAANVDLVRRKSQIVFVAVVLWATDALLLLAAALTSSA